MNEALNEAVYERFKFIEEKLYWLQFIRFFRVPFIVQMLHIPALTLRSSGRGPAKIMYPIVELDWEMLRM